MSVTSGCEAAASLTGERVGPSGPPKSSLTVCPPPTRYRGRGALKRNTMLFRYGIECFRCGLPTIDLEKAAVDIG